MTAHVVIGTAGHVDHGKTALVRFLTGTDTDRWAEEKRRGITIDLGFAALGLGDSMAASIVDVPGHEDFVRNMVAGATGIDVALLVVAADEGVMPQTREHLAILEFLGVRTGVVAITKVDLIDDPEWLDLVEADVVSRLEDSSIRWAAPVRCSAESGAGGDALIAALREAADGAQQRSADDLFRLPIDRAFSVAGAGTVVTGTTWSGAVGVGDQVRIFPGGAGARVRSVEVHGETRERAEPGRRTALALPGIERGAAPRGAVVVAGPGWHETTALDVWLTLMPDAPRLTQRSRIRLHLGTAEVFARLTPAADAVEPGTRGAVRLRLEEPVVARWGDRGVIRTYSPMHTIGGCAVVDPFPARRPRRPRDLEGKGAPNAVARGLAFVMDAGRAGLPVSDLPVRVGVHPNEVDRVVRELERQHDSRVVAGKLLAADVMVAVVANVRDRVEGHHAANPLEAGIAIDALRAGAVDSAQIDAAVHALVEDGKLEIDGATVRRAGFSPSASEEDERLATAIREALAAAGAEGLTETELGSVVPPARVRDLVGFEVRRGVVTRVGRDRYYATESLERLQGIIIGLVRERGRATPAEIRDATGLTRKYLIPVLEWLDASGVTVRDGDARRVGPAAPSDGRNS